MLDATLLERLKADGWSLNEEAVVQQLEEILPSSGEAKQRPDDIIKAILDLDLKQVGAPSLPEDINRADSNKLTGPHILQLVEATDISRPSRFQETVPEDRKNRLLRLRLTDGSKICRAMEYTSIPSLHTKQLIPGVKIKIQNAPIRVGSLLLDSKSVVVLGGRVERLAAAWEVQQMYGGTAERGSTKDTNNNSTATAAADSSSSKPDKPLPFKHFDAKASTGGHEKMKKALAAVYVPSVGVVVQAVGGKNSGPNSQQRNNNIKDSLPQPPGASATTTATTSDAAKSKLLERLSAHEDAHGRYGRGSRGGRGGGGRKGRRGRFNNDDDVDDGSMTLEEWEAKKKAGIGGGGGGASAVEKSDEQLARELQRQLDLEDMGVASAPRAAPPPPPPGLGGGAAANKNGGDLQSSLLGMFNYDQNEDEYGGGGGGGGGRGHSRGRGRRGGRGRGGGGGGGRGSGSGGGRGDGGRGGGGRAGGGGGRGRGPPSRGRGRGGRS